MFVIWQEDWERFRARREAENQSQAAIRGRRAEQRLAEERWIQHNIAKVSRGWQRRGGYSATLPR